MNIDQKLSLKLLEEIKEMKNSSNKTGTSLYKPNLTFKNIRFSNLPKALSKKLQKKIIKESLILGLREEYNHNEKMKEILTNYLNNVNKYKERVKKNKDDVQQNCDNLKQEFYDRFLIIENYEKQIKLLDEEKQEIIKTNTEIIEMKGQQTYDLQRQLNKVQEETNAQREVINDLNGKIAVLEEKKANLNNEFDEIVRQQDIGYKKMMEEYSILAQKCDFYQKEYNKFEKYPEELTKVTLNLFDNTRAKNILTEENLNIDLAEKKFVKDKLMSKLNYLHKQIDEFEEKQKEMKKKERLFGKSLNTFSNSKKGNKTQNTNTYMNTNYSTKSNKRAKTTSNSKKKKSFLE